jgi:capsular exopolysaccharide synthesis family protein
VRMGEQPPGIREFLRILWLRKWSLVLVTVIVVAVALVYSFLQTPLYESTAEVLVRPITFSPTQPGTAPGFVNMETEQRVATSAEVVARAEEIIRQRQLQPGKITVETSEEVETLAFSALSPQPRAARATAQAYAVAYLTVREEHVLRDLQSARQPLEAEISSLNERIVGVERELFGQRNPSQRASLQVEYTNLLSQRAALETQLNALIAPDAVRVGEVLQPAVLASEPVSPDHMKTGAFALFVGLSLGIGVSFLRERLDQRVRDREGLEEATAGLPVLGAIPRTPRPRRGQRVLPVSGPSSESSEGYKALRTSLVVASARNGWKTVMLTSATPGEGKTSTVANLGVALANTGKQVILVSADLRRPELHQYFSVSDRLGLRDILSQARERRGTSRQAEAVSPSLLKEALLPVGGIPNLLILSSGSALGEPPELLGSKAMEDLIHWLKSSADFVLIDTPPVLGMADAMSLAPLVDAVMLVASSGEVSEGALQDALHRLEGVEARVIGAVLNKYDPTRSRDYYTNYYTRDDGPAPRQRKRASLRPVDGLTSGGRSSTQTTPQ